MIRGEGMIVVVTQHNDRVILYVRSYIRYSDTVRSHKEALVFSLLNYVVILEYLMILNMVQLHEVGRWGPGSYFLFCKAMRRSNQISVTKVKRTKKHAGCIQ